MMVLIFCSQSRKLGKLIDNTMPDCRYSDAKTIGYTALERVDRPITSAQSWYLIPLSVSCLTDVFALK